MRWLRGGPLPPHPRGGKGGRPGCGLVSLTRNAAPRAARPPPRRRGSPPPEQRVPRAHADQRLLAEPHRVPVHGGASPCPGREQPPVLGGRGARPEARRGLPQYPPSSGAVKSQTTFVETALGMENRSRLQP